MFAFRIALMLISVGVGVLLDGLVSSSRYFATLKSFDQDALVVAPHHFEESVPSARESNGDKRIAWLMSFPNSGTSYTSFLVRTVSSTLTGSNYGRESGTIADILSESVGIFADNPVPSWTESWNQKYFQPSKGYILTKTHCGGYCATCNSFIHNSHTFLKRCLEGDYVTHNVNTGELDIRRGWASQDKIARAVHIIRDPFDNVVARFHLERENLKQSNKANFPNTRDGFRDFCADVGMKTSAQEQASVFFEEVRDLDIPCRADFYRYVQWHNLAFTTIWNLGIPSLIIHYENYTNNFDETKESLLEFLEQDEVNEPPTFVTGKTYREYYSQEEIDAVSSLFVKLALEKTWSNTKHYFGAQ